jgi:hypothetical protein
MLKPQTIFRTLGVASIALLLNRCDVIDDPVVPQPTGYRSDLYGDPPSFEQVDAAIQRVLIEDFTAHQCGNCPNAAIIAEDLAEADDRVSVMAIHAGNLAATDGDHFDTDWTTEEGDVYWNQLEFQANPLGRINRLPNAGNFFAPAQWEGEVNAALGASPQLHLEGSAAYVPGNNHLNVHVFGQAMSDDGSAINLAVLILESHIIDYQLDYSATPSVVEDYEFNHVLRGSLSGPMGLSFGDLGDGMSINETATASFTFDWPNEWLAENATVLAVATNAEGAVINVAEIHPVE